MISQYNIHWCLYFVDNRDLPKYRKPAYSKLQVIELILAYMNNKFSKIFKAGKEIVLMRLWFHSKDVYQWHKIYRKSQFLAGLKYGWEQILWQVIYVRLMLTQAKTLSHMIALILQALYIYIWICMYIYRYKYRYSNLHIFLN